MTELWRTSGAPLGSFPNAFISATASGSLVVSVAVGTSTAEALVIDGTGNPTGSYYESGSMRTRALIGSGGGIWFPLETTNPGSGLISLTPAFQPRLLGGICGSSWLLGHAGGTGLLATSKGLCNAIYNGGFETGTLLDWTPSGASTSISTPAAHSGSFGTMLGSASATNGDSTVQQTFTVPSSGGTLTFWYKNVCPDSLYYDWFIGTLQNASGGVLATIVPKTCTPSGSWTQATLNLAPYAGQTVVVVLTSHDDNYSSDPTYTFVDDISRN